MATMDPLTQMFADALAPLLNLFFQFVTQVVGFVLTAEFAAQVAQNITGV